MLQQIRNYAYSLDYMLYYPGCYCHKAEFIPMFDNTLPVFEVDMRDGVYGLQYMAGILWEISQNYSGA